MDHVNQENVIQSVDIPETTGERITNTNNESVNAETPKFSIKISKKPVPATPRGVLAE